MKIPNIDCTIMLHASVNISEDPEKVKQAVSNVLPFDEINVKESFVRATSDDIASLEKIYETNIEWVDEDYFEGKKISKLHL